MQSESGILKDKLDSYSKLNAWILDVSEDIEGKEPAVLLWVINEEGKRLTLRTSYFPSVYLVKEGSSPEQIVEAIKKAFSKEITSAEVVKRKSKGKTLEAIRIKLKSSEVEEITRKILKKFNLEAFNFDIRYTAKFLLENRLEPSSWYEFNLLQKRDNIIEVKPEFKKIEKARPRLISIAFEPIYFSEHGSPKPDRDPVVAIAIFYENGAKVLEGKEKEILEEFCEEIKKIDPDVIVGFQNNQVHWNYLLKRAKINSVKLEIGRNLSEPHQSVFGHFSIQGRINIDLFDLVKDTPEVKLETLEEYAEFLGISVNYRPIEDFELPEKWKKDKESVRQYLFGRVSLMHKIYKSLEDFIFELSRITSLPADQVIAASAGFRVENYLMKKAEEFGELIPERKEIVHESYKGAIVKEPIPGIHENVAVIDFKSMYPSLMIKHNISFDTITKNGEKAPGLDFGFSKEQGFLPMALKELIKERDTIREAMKNFDKESTEFKVLDSRQRVIKVITNAIYGYTGWSGARWYSREVAEATTAWGRATITSSIEKAKEIGLKVIYSDTDSIFVNYDEEKVQSFLDWVKMELGLEAKIDKIYRRVLFTEAKKKYAGIREDGKLEIVGLEAVRGDWSSIAKEVQSKVIEKILETGSKEEGLKILNEYISLLRGEKVEIEKLIIWKQITRPLDSYEATAPHVVVAKYLVSKGWKIEPGDKVGYVVVKGTGRLYTRVKPYFEVKKEDVDWQYYIENQVIASCARIFETLKVNIEKVGRYRQSTLFGSS